MSAAPLAPAGDLLVQASRREVAVGEEFSFTVTRTAHPAAPLVGVELVFPGFTEKKQSAAKYPRLYGA